jgi:quercetin dioxygenase-like cupin family protein
MNYSQPIRALEALEAKIQSKAERSVSWLVGNEAVKAKTVSFKEGRHTIVESFGKAGGQFPPHDHTQTEHIIVTKGEALLHLEGVEEPVRLKSGDGVKISPGQGHVFETVQDTWIIAVLVPHSEAFSR